MFRKLAATVIYGATALGTANWLEYGLWPQQPYGHSSLMLIALLGSLAFGLAGVLSPFNQRYGLMAAFSGACLSAPYFTMLLISLLRTGIAYHVKYDIHGQIQVLAICLVLGSTLYSIARVRVIRGNG